MVTVHYNPFLSLSIFPILFPFQFLWKVFLFRFFIRKIMSVFVSFAVSELFHKTSRSISYVHRYRKISMIFDIFFHREHRHIDGVISWSCGEIICEITEDELSFRHSHFLANLKNTICIYESIRIRYSDVFRCEI